MSGEKEAVELAQSIIKTKEKYQYYCGAKSCGVIAEKLALALISLSGENERLKANIKDDYESNIKNGHELLKLQSENATLKAEVERLKEYPYLKELCEALGWQGGTIHEVLKEVKWLKRELHDIKKICDDRGVNY